MVATVTLQIPDGMYQRLVLNAQATHRSVEEMLLHSIDVGRPPIWTDAPVEFQEDLARLDGLSDEVLWQLMGGQKSEAELERYDELLELNAAGGLSAAERQELAGLRQEADRFMLCKAQAAVLLRWRGHDVSER
jgi:hypothetical protein